MNGCDVLSPRLRQLYVHDIGAEDWRIAMTTDRVALVALELAAVAIHPYPVGLVSYFEQSLLRTPPRLSLSETELEIILALPMFLRFYLLGRAMMLHSRLFTDTASRSIGALNKVGVYASAAGDTSTPLRARSGTSRVVSVRSSPTASTPPPVVDELSDNLSAWCWTCLCVTVKCLLVELQSDRHTGG